MNESRLELGAFFLSKQIEIYSSYCLSSAFAFIYFYLTKYSIECKWNVIFFHLFPYLSFLASKIFFKEFSGFLSALLRNKSNEVGENNFQKTCLIQAQKPPPVVTFLVFPVIFETTTEALRQEHFLDLHVIDFIKNHRLTISAPITLSIS